MYKFLRWREAFLREIEMNDEFLRPMLGYIDDRIDISRFDPSFVILDATNSLYLSEKRQRIRTVSANYI
jgi:hypothetical protein